MNVADHARKLNTVRKKTAHFFTIRKARFIKGGGLVIKKQKNNRHIAETFFRFIVHCLTFILLDEIPSKLGN